MAPPLRIRHSYALIRGWVRDVPSPEAPIDETTLQHATGASRTEVREVLGHLTADGLLRRRQRSGTLVDSRFADFAIDLPLAYQAATTERYRQVTLHEESVPASDALVRLFGEPDEGHYLLADSRIELDGTPLAVRTSFWRGSERRRPSPAGRGDTDMARSFARTFGVPLASCDARVDALSATERFAGQLRVAPGEPLLLREAVLTGTDGVVHEVNVTFYASRRISLTVTTPYDAD
ncbi:GntR family transcriptional regulator [Microbacterium betulae]|uniref:GntR family transcriptional regulator n=1 Tax=Microbacterium betulae TaxID=2981139 RepID=A0AA97FHR5_9MICO|nr:GntR family transcriptional regulator [Microbacterium sp. AB]WOF23438.1 GntR family transcriptional regulator [Microbacterium sp. AB]